MGNEELPALDPPGMTAAPDANAGASAPEYDHEDEWIHLHDNGEKLSSHVSRDLLKHLPQLVALAVLDDVGDYVEAGKLLTRGDRWVRDTVKDLADELSVSGLLEQGPRNRMQVSGQIASQAREIGRAIVYLAGSMHRLRDRNVRVRYLPQHGFFMAKVEADLGATVDLHPKTLGEEDRAMERFRDEVISAVALGTVDLAIGLPPERAVAVEHKLEVTYLYSSRQEAMIPAEEPRDQITLAELATRDLLLPPPRTRSRDTLEKATAVDVQNAGPLRVRREAFGTKVLIQYGMRGLGTVVVPSDIAHVFKYGNDYGGPATQAYKWVPVVDAKERYIHQKVYATTRRTRDVRTDDVRRVLDGVKAEVARLGLETDPNNGNSTRRV